MHALLFFGEGPHDRNYHLPESLSEAVIQVRSAEGKTTELQPEYHETDEVVGLRAPLKTKGDFVLQSVCQYGVYHGTLLTYCPKHVHCTSQEQWSRFKPDDALPLEIIPVATADGIECTILRSGKPLADSKVTMSTGESEPVVKTSDAAGKVMFPLSVTGGVGIYANYVDKDVAGELHGEKYTSATLYATLNVTYRAKSPATPKHDDEVATTTTSDYPPLPEAVASFGGAVHDGWLYVYSGHIGGQHEHSRENLSQRFVRLKLDDGRQWEELPMQTPIQGHALVAHGGVLYRIGGMNARNAPGEDDDLHSVSEFARFDPASKTWSMMPSLPEPRSSHDAVVLGDKLYVVGGWELEGPGHGVWHTSGYVFDLVDPNARWQPLPEPPLARRALAASHWKGQIALVCGMTDASEVTRRVDFLDPNTGEWSEGPELPGEQVHGFGVSAWNLNGKLYASGIGGELWQLADDGSRWSEVARLEFPRFFHRLLPAGDGTLLAVAGASFEHGHLDNIERIDLTVAKVAATER
jgi:hypothetical protein